MGLLTSRLTVVVGDVFGEAGKSSREFGELESIVRLHKALAGKQHYQALASGLN